ncbi:uncharacterized [Lates japonicus]
MTDWNQVADSPHTGGNSEGSPTATAQNGGVVNSPQFSNVNCGGEINQTITVNQTSAEEPEENYAGNTTVTAQDGGVINTSQFSHVSTGGDINLTVTVTKTSGRSPPL